MNVAKIQKLTEQHKALKKFYQECTKSGVELSANDSETGLAPADLDFNTTRLILTDVRDSLLKEITKIEEDIFQEATK